jgi:hypothetical protein
MNNGLGIEDGNGSHSTRKFPTLLAGGGKLGLLSGSVDQDIDQPFRL